MPRKTGDLNDPAVWMGFAKSDLVLAQKGRWPEVRLGALCYHCQQAAEKALKAVLLRHRVEFPPTHNLTDLFELLPPPLSAPPRVKAAQHLSGYAVKGRYPLDFKDISSDEYETAVRLAGEVMRWAEKVLSGDFHTGAQESPAPYRTRAKREPKARKRPRKKK